MYVCVCMGVCDGEIESAIEAGASSVEAVMIATRAGTRCGSCRPEIAQMLRTGGEDRPSLHQRV